MGRSLLDKVWDLHRVGSLPTGQDQLFVGLHLVHEVTSPQAFDMLSERGLGVAYPYLTYATVDHIVPTHDRCRPFEDPLAERMMQALEANAERHGITFFGLDSPDQGIVHILGPEMGLTQPGMTIACGDSHTSTHGALGSLAFGIGTSQVRDVLATQTLALSRPLVRRIGVQGRLRPGVFAKDVILRIIAQLGVNAGIGYAYEYAGEVIGQMDMEERLTICNMSIEGGARVGYINPDETTFAYLRERPRAPQDAAWERALSYWKDVSSDADASYADEVEIDGESVEPMVAWGITPGQAVGVGEKLPRPSDAPPDHRRQIEAAYEHTGFTPGSPVAGLPIDVAFIGSCTNGRITDLREAAAVARGRRVAEGVRALVVPGSRRVEAQAQEESLDSVFRDAGFEWRSPGCSMCLAMNPDRITDRQVCASSSNRNFIGRQGAPGGRTLLMSPAMVAAAAVSGEIVDVREMA